MSKTKLSIIVLTTTCLFLIPAQTAHGLDISTKEVLGVPINKPDSAVFELPFSVVQQGSRILNISTGWTYNCWTFEHPINQVVNLPLSNCTKTQRSQIHDNENSQPPWFRNYAGTFTNHLASIDGQTQLISINHGENKNEIVESTRHQNTVNTDISVAECSSGVVNGSYRDCADAYHSFITLSYSPFISETSYGMNFPQTDLGPITWPTQGYLSTHPQDSSKNWSHSFVRHPHGLTVGEYFYVFYHEQSSYSENKGIKVIRTKLSEIKNNNFQKYCQNQWLPALPTGFNKNNISNFYNQPSSCSTPIISAPPNSDQISFAATKIRGTDLYLGVEEIVQSGTWKINLYQSNNLLDWQYQKTLLFASSYQQGSLHYPLFLDQEASTNESVDNNRFYLVGTSGHNTTNYIEVSINNQQQTLDGDLNSDGNVDIFDYQKLISKFGNPYTIFDYQKITANFGN